MTEQCLHLFCNGPARKVPSAVVSSIRKKDVGTSV